MTAIIDGVAHFNLWSIQSSARPMAVPTLDGVICQKTSDRWRELRGSLVRCRSGGPRCRSGDDIAVITLIWLAGTVPSAKGIVLGLFMNGRGAKASGSSLLLFPMDIPRRTRALGRSTFTGFASSTSQQLRHDRLLDETKKRSCSLVTHNAIKRWFGDRRERTGNPFAMVRSHCRLSERLWFDWHFRVRCFLMKDNT